MKNRKRFCQNKKIFTPVFIVLLASTQMAAVQSGISGRKKQIPGQGIPLWELGFGVFLGRDSKKGHE